MSVRVEANKGKHNNKCMGDRKQIQIKRIQGKLHRKGDSIYIPDLKCNGTILKFHRKLVSIQPHDYGKSVKRLPKNLRLGCGINHCVCLTLHSLNIYFRDEVVLRKGTFPVPWRLEYAKPYFRQQL